MAECLLYLAGDNGEIELYEDKIIIKREGIFAKLSHGFFKGEKSIYLKQISGIQIKPASTFLVGYIQFTVSGGIERTNGILEATRDENTVTFTKKDNVTAYAIQQKVEELKNMAVPYVNQISQADEIRKFKSLMDDGIITEEEFAARKRQLLNL